MHAVAPLAPIDAAFGEGAGHVLETLRRQRQVDRRQRPPEQLVALDAEPVGGRLVGADDAAVAIDLQHDVARQVERAAQREGRSVRGIAPLGEAAARAARRSAGAVLVQRRGHALRLAARVALEQQAHGELAVALAVLLHDLEAALALAREHGKQMAMPDRGVVGPRVELDRALAEQLLARDPEFGRTGSVGVDDAQHRIEAQHRFDAVGEEASGRTVGLAREEPRGERLRHEVAPGSASCPARRRARVRVRRWRVAASTRGCAWTRYGCSR